eukprot:7402807-Alexandrium_andersonii.AAC.1
MESFPRGLESTGAAVSAPRESAWPALGDTRAQRSARAPNRRARGAGVGTGAELEHGSREHLPARVPPKGADCSASKRARARGASTGSGAWRPTASLDHGHGFE